MTEPGGTLPKRRGWPSRPSQSGDGLNANRVIDEK